MTHTSINLVTNTPPTQTEGGTSYLVNATNYIEGQVIKNYAADWLSRKLIYIDGGSGTGLSGNLLCIESSISQ